MIEGKYGREGWNPCEVRGGYEAGVGKAITKEWDLFFSKTSNELSTIKKVKF